MFTLPDLPYNYAALEPYIDEETMRLHHDRHHGAYVENLNSALAGNEQFLQMSVEDVLRNIQKVPEAIRTKVRNHGGGHANHSLFWQIMGPKQETEPQGSLITVINTTFGSLMGLQEAVSKAAMARFGSGWAWVVVVNGKLEIIDTPNQDSPLMERKTPILGIDVWEHAYYLKYQNRRADYLKAWWNVVNWKEVEKRFLAAS